MSPLEASVGKALASGSMRSSVNGSLSGYQKYYGRTAGGPPGRREGRRRARGPHRRVLAARHPRARRRAEKGRRPVHTLKDSTENTFDGQDESDPIIEDLEVTLEALREEL